jgi:putative Mn2+ efflux pump MntP
VNATVLLLGIWAGMDNLQVCSSVALAPIPRGRLHRLAAMSCICETAAPVAGLLLGKALLSVLGVCSQITGPAMMIVCGIAIFRSSLRGDDQGLSEAGAFALPVSLCLDNLVAGIGVSPAVGPAWTAALSIGLISASMSCVGVYGAQWLRKIIYSLHIPRLEMLGAAYLVMLGLRTLAERVT